MVELRRFPGKIGKPPIFRGRITRKKVGRVSTFHRQQKLERWSNFYTLTPTAAQPDDPISSFQIRSAWTFGWNRQRIVEHEMGPRLVSAARVDHRLLVSNQRNQIVWKGQ